MNHKAYSKTYNQLKTTERQRMNEAIEKLKRDNPQRLLELQVQAIRELHEPPKPRIVTRYAPRYHPFNADEFIRQHHTQSYYISTEDCWNESHLYFESLDNETAEEVLTRRHSKFTERSEKVVKVEKCVCPLCLGLN